MGKLEAATKIGRSHHRRGAARMGVEAAVMAKAGGLATELAGGGGAHDRADLGKNRADAPRDARHEGACGHGDKTRHQCVLDEVLSAIVFPDLQFQNRFRYAFHLVYSVSCVWLSLIGL